MLDLKNKQKILQAVFLADSYTMPLQWNYEQDSIVKLTSDGSINVDMLNSGKYSQYFPNKQAGEQTHYGDQLLHLLSYAQEHGNFAPNAYVQNWKAFIDSYDGHVDKSSKTVLQNLNENKDDYTSVATDFIGVVCGISLIWLAGTRAEAENLLIQRSDITHKDELVRASIRWLLHMAEEISLGNSVSSALDTTGVRVENKTLKDIIEKGRSLADSSKDSIALIQDTGLGCSLENNLPYSIILLLRYKLDYLQTLKTNILAGSDAASRAIFLSFLIANNKSSSIPVSLFEQLKIRDKL